MTTTITYLGLVTADAYGRDRHDVRLAGPMARSIKTWFVRHAGAVRSLEDCAAGEIRVDVFDPPRCWPSLSGVSDVLLRARLGCPCRGVITYVDARGDDADRPADVVDLRHC